MWKLAALALAIVVAIALVNAHRHADAADIASSEDVLSCVRAAGLPADIERSSTGTLQVIVTHGPGLVSANTTLESSQTTIAYLPSDEAAWFVQQLRDGGSATGISSDLVSQHGNAVVIIGMTATPSERTAIEGCLA